MAAVTAVAVTAAITPNATVAIAPAARGGIGMQAQHDIHPTQTTHAAQAKHPVHPAVTGETPSISIFFTS